jgi:hypothetical protein
MKLHVCWLPALLVAFACSTKSVDDDDDDSNGGDSGESSSGGSSGKAGRGAGGNASGGTQGGADAEGGSATGGAAAGGSSGTATGGSDATGGTGGSSAAAGSGQAAVGGDMGQSGDGQAGDASPGSGGTDATGGTGGTGGTSGTSGDGGTGGGGSDEPPLVQLLIDGSSSMFENGMWEQIHASLVTDGVVDAFAGQLNLGLSVFQGSTTPSTEMSASCATMTSTEFATDSGEAVASTLTTLSNNYMVGDKYETPTGFAVNYAAMVLAATSVPAGVKKYLVLVTDGAPNTCAVLDPQCGEDVSIKAVQDARTNGIRTLAVGLEPILVDSGCPGSARCGADHIQDLANAGVAQPIEPPDITAFIHEQCNDGEALLASYAAVGGGGDATYYFNTNEGGLTGELTKAFQAIVDDAVP